MSPPHTRHTSQPGMAYVALSRARSLEQLHLWGFDVAAIHADPTIEAEYTRLRSTRLLTTEAVQRAPLQQPVTVPPLVATVVRPAQ